MKPLLLSLLISCAVTTACVYFVGLPYAGQQRMAEITTPESAKMSNTARQSATQLNKSTLNSASRHLDNANKVYLACGAFALLFTTLTLGASFFIYRFSNEKSATEQRISDEKDRGLETYKATVASQVADARREGIEAGKAAGNAILRAAQLEKEAANARLETEKIKQAVAWRSIPSEAASSLESALAASPGAVNIRYTEGDPEALVLAIQFARIFERAHWEVALGALKMIGAIFTGIDIPPHVGTDMETLQDAFRAAQIPFLSEPIPASGVLGNMGSTIPGAPTIVIGSKLRLLP